MTNKTSEEYPPIATPEMEKQIEEFYREHSEIMSDNSWIQTHTGKRFFPLNPRIEDIDIEDIAHALSMICRYTGHIKSFYSVAEHSVLVSYLGDSKYGLLHDASEAYIADIASPIKKMPQFDFYRKIEKNLQTMIYKKFGLDDPEPPSLLKADLLMLSTEASHLLQPLDKDWKINYKPLPVKVKSLKPKKAKQLFLERFAELFG